MSLIDTRREQLFPVLTAHQVDTARRFAAAPARRYEPGALLFGIGERHAPSFLVVAGSLDVVRRDGAGHEGVITSHGPGEISGEISQLGGRAALAEGRAGPEGCEALSFDAAHLRALIIGAADVGEIVMRAFILRRTALITEGGAGSVLVGRVGDPTLVRIEGFLARNGYPYSVLDDAEGEATVERLGLHDGDLPLVLCPDGTVLKRPSDAEVGACLGITPELDPAKVYDVAVIGAGPAGLATAVYAASEGLSVLVLDARAFGGQAGASSRIENYLGFPTGISGMALTARAFTQAQKFGAEIAIPIRVSGIDCGGADRKPGDLFRLDLEAGGSTQARAVVVASGAHYRRPAIDNLHLFEGAGVSYWASPVEAKLCEGEEVALVGAGNSAGQAVVYLAPRVRKLHLVVRGDGLAASMSRYLIERIEALPNVEIHTRTEVTALSGDATSGLEGASFRNRDTGAVWTGPLRHLFLFIGADPNTRWLEGCTVAVDGKGFVRTGETATGSPWSTFGRSALPLETSVPGVFAIGDVRAGSTKRVAAAVGEGAQVVAAIHGILADA
jgi:thioredoxin reductase (NADPH)